MCKTPYITIQVPAISLLPKLDIVQFKVSKSPLLPFCSQSPVMLNELLGDFNLTKKFNHNFVSTQNHYKFYDLSYNNTLDFMVSHLILVQFSLLHIIYIHKT